MPVIRKERSIDWSEVVFSLNRAGANTKLIADNLSVTRQTVGQWRSGVCSPSYENGAALLGLWQMKLKLDHNRIPRIT